MRSNCFLMSPEAAQRAFQRALDVGIPSRRALYREHCCCRALHTLMIGKQKSITRKTAERIASILDLTVEALITGEYEVEEMSEEERERMEESLRKIKTFEAFYRGTL